MSCVLLVLALSIGVQGDISEEVHRHIQSLRSANLKKRVRAEKALISLGPLALPEIKKHLNDPDSEVSSRLRHVAWELKNGHRITTNLRHYIPNVRGRLMSGDSHEWTLVFFDAWRIGRSQISSIRPSDLGGLVPHAVRGAQNYQEKLTVCRVIDEVGLRNEAIQLLSYFKDENSDVRKKAAIVLGRWRTPGCAEALRSLLDDKNWHVRHSAIYSLTRINDHKAAPKILLFLGKPAGFSDSALGALGRIGSEKHVTLIRPFLKDKDASVRLIAATTLCDLGSSEGVSELFREVNDRIYRLEVMNALRFPLLWDRLHNQIAPTHESMKQHEVAGIIKDDLKCTEAFSEFWVKKGIHYRSYKPGKLSYYEVLERHLQRNDPEIDRRVEFIIEKDRILFVTRHEALKFWRRWWTEEQKKQPRK